MEKEKIDVRIFLGEMGFGSPPKMSKGEILKIFYDAEDSFSENNLPYTYVEEFSQRGDGSGYETFWVFKRKSDDKYFYYYSYDGRFEYDELVETEKIVKSKWAFECSY